MYYRCAINISADKSFHLYSFCNCNLIYSSRVLQDKIKPPLVSTKHFKMSILLVEAVMSLHDEFLSTVEMYEILHERSWTVSTI